MGINAELAGKTISIYENNVVITKGTWGCEQHTLEGSFLSIQTSSMSNPVSGL
jgi:hypothetical protein